tara:strand:- start:625 stop:876 length:252 start_codon:yes stop_codon:yes gene_type:complete
MKTIDSSVALQIELARKIAENIVIENNPQSVIYKYNEYGDECGYLDEIQDQFYEVYDIVIDSIRNFWTIKKIRRIQSEIFKND